jgi:hypothetical protein
LHRQRVLAWRPRMRWSNSFLFFSISFRSCGCVATDIQISIMQYTKHLLKLYSTKAMLLNHLIILILNYNMSCRYNIVLLAYLHFMSYRRFFDSNKKKLHTFSRFSIKATNSVYYHAKSLINHTVVSVDSIANDTIQQFNHSQLEYLLIKSCEGSTWLKLLNSLLRGTHARLK